MSETKDETSRAERKKELDQADLEECRSKIEQALKEHSCEIVGWPVLTADGRVTAQVGVQNKRG